MFCIAALEAVILQAIGMLPIQAHRICPAAQAEQVVHRVQVVHIIIVTDDLSKGCAAAIHHAIVRYIEDLAGEVQQWIGDVSPMGRLRGTCPGIVTDVMSPAPWIVRPRAVLTATKHSTRYCSCRAGIYG